MGVELGGKGLGKGGENGGYSPWGLLSLATDVAFTVARRKSCLSTRSKSGFRVHAGTGSKAPSPPSDHARLWDEVLRQGKDELRW